MAEDDCTHEDLVERMGAFTYYLYRLAGCPYGDTQQGWSMWIDLQSKAFEKFVGDDEEGEGDE